MKLKQEITENYLESLLKEDFSGDIFIQYPNSFKYLKFDLRPRLFQVITTIHNKYSIQSVTIPNYDVENTDFYNNLEFICFITRSRFLTSDSDDNLIKDYTSKLKNELLKMDNFASLNVNGGNVKGGGIQILNFDWRDSFCFWKTVYDINKEFLNEEIFVMRHSEMILKATQLKNNKDEIKDIVKILYELYKNTHDHAYTNNIQELSIRGYYTKKISINISHDEETKYPQYFEYIKKILKFQDKREGVLNFLELSVFDSGKGYYYSTTHKIPKEGVNIDEEKEITLKCFEKHFSSKDSGVHGLGLSSVIDLLKKLKGYMTIRTGRLKLSFNGMSLNQKETFQIETFSYIKGTSINIIIPEQVGGAV